MPSLQFAFMHVRHIHNAVAELAVPFRRKTNSMRFHKRSATYFAHTLQTKEHEKRVVDVICHILKPFLDFKVSFYLSQVSAQTCLTGKRRFTAPGARPNSPSLPLADRISENARFECPQRGG